jgi:hypothetical protein
MSSYQIDPEPTKDERYIFVKLAGRAEAETILRLLDELSALAERNASLRVLIDEDGLGAGLIGLTDIGRIIAAWRRAKGFRSTRIAVFVSNLAIYGLNRMFLGLSGRDSEGRINVFTDRAAATAWLLES